MVELMHHNSWFYLLSKYQARSTEAVSQTSSLVAYHAEPARHSLMEQCSVALEVVARVENDGFVEEGVLSAACCPDKYTFV